MSPLFFVIVDIWRFSDSTYISRSYFIFFSLPTTPINNKLYMLKKTWYFKLYMMFETISHQFFIFFKIFLLLFFSLSITYCFLQFFIIPFWLHMMMILFFFFFSLILFTFLFFDTNVAMTRTRGWRDDRFFCNFLLFTR